MGVQDFSFSSCHITPVWCIESQRPAVARTTTWCLMRASPPLRLLHGRTCDTVDIVKKTNEINRKVTVQNTPPPDVIQAASPGGDRGPHWRDGGADRRWLRQRLQQPPGKYGAALGVLQGALGRCEVRARPPYFLSNLPDLGPVLFERERGGVPSSGRSATGGGESKRDLFNVKIVITAWSLYRTYPEASGRSSRPPLLS